MWQLSHTPYFPWSFKVGKGINLKVLFIDCQGNMNATIVEVQTDKYPFNNEECFRYKCIGHTHQKCRQGRNKQSSRKRKDNKNIAVNNTDNCLNQGMEMELYSISMSYSPLMQVELFVNMRI